MHNNKKNSMLLVATTISSAAWPNDGYTFASFQGKLYSISDVSMNDDDRLSEIKESSLWKESMQKRIILNDSISSKLLLEQTVSTWGNKKNPYPINNNNHNHNNALSH